MSYDGKLAEPAECLLQENSYQRFVYHAKTKEGENLKIVLAPEFWGAVARKVRVGDVFEIIADDDTWEWHGRVIRLGKNQLFFRQMFYWDEDRGFRAMIDENMSTSPAITKKPYHVAWTSPTPSARWAVRTPHDEILIAGFESRGAAEDFKTRFLNGELSDEEKSRLRLAV